MRYSDDNVPVWPELESSASFTNLCSTVSAALGCSSVVRISDIVNAYPAPQLTYSCTSPGVASPS